MVDFFKSSVRRLADGQSFLLSSVPDGFDALVVADLTRYLAKTNAKGAATLFFIARDGQRQADRAPGRRLA